MLPPPPIESALQSAPDATVSSDARGLILSANARVAT